MHAALRVCALLLVLPLPGAARAAEQILTLDPSATRLGFTLGATLHTVVGTIALAQGSIRFDADTGAAAGEIVVDAPSASTGLALRDRNLHRDVLESARFPRIVFRPDHLDVARRDATRAEVSLQGTLELHGARKPLALPASLTARGDRLAIECRFRLPYVDWGVPDPSTLLLRVARFVDVTVEAEGSLAPP